MIGAIHFAEGLTASLDDSGRWECAHQGIEQQLNALFRPGDGPGLIAVLPPGEAVARAARFYGAHAELPEDQQRQSEVVLFGEEGEMSPLPYRGQRIKSLSGYDVKAAKRNVRGQDCPPGYNPERDGCRKVAKKPKQPKSQSVYSDRGKKPESGGARVMTPEEIKTVLRRRGEVDVADAIDKMSRSDSTYDATDWQYRNGLLSQSEWEAYNYLFANTTDRFSGIAASYDLRGDATNQDSTIPEGYSIREMPEEMRRRYGGNKLGLFREGQSEPVNSMVDDTEEAILEMVSKLQGPDGTTGFAVLDNAKRRRKPVSEDDRQRKKRERELRGPAWARRGPGAMFGRKPTPPKVPESPTTPANEQDEKVGTKWNSVRGERVVIGKHPSGRYMVQTGGEGLPELMDAQRLEEDRRRDTANYESRLKKQREEQEAAAREAERKKNDPVESFITDMGYTPMRAAKVRTTLGKYVRSGDKVMTTRQFVIESIINGAVPDNDERDGQGLRFPDGGFVSAKQITLTAIEFARHYRDMVRKYTIG